ncbi:MAG TPA: hypothetical protein VMU99_01570 [Acidimicrobiales bacterium]|nr:hypothetical protein [Acidimicrobiales bacterium]
MRFPKWLKPEIKSPRDELQDVLDEAKRYFVAQTLAPLKSIGRKLLFGLSGALVAGIGIVLCLVGLLRVLQIEVGNTFAGMWTFVPYFLVAVSGILVSAIVILVGFRRYRKRVNVS